MEEVKLFHHLVLVKFDGTARDKEDFSDFLYMMAFRHELQDFALARCQC